MTRLLPDFRIIVEGGHKPGKPDKRLTRTWEGRIGRGPDWCISHRSRRPLKREKGEFGYVKMYHESRDYALRLFNALSPAPHFMLWVNLRFESPVYARERELRLKGVRAWRREDWKPAWHKEDWKIEEATKRSAGRRGLK